MGSQSGRQQQYALDLADKSRRRSAPRAHNLTEVSPQTILDVGPYLHKPPKAETIFFFIDGLETMLFTIYNKKG